MTTDFSDISEAMAQQLLQLALAPKTSPVDELLKHLIAGDCGFWLQTAVTETVGPDRAQAERLLVHGKATIEELEALKERSKALFRTAESHDGQLRATLLYFLVHGAFVVHHRMLSTNRTKAELKEAFGALAAAVPPPWSDLLARAATTVPKLK